MIIQDFFQKGTNARPGLTMSPRFITIHNVGAKSTADEGRRFFKRNSHKYVSVHFFVDDKQTIQLVPLDEVAWHAGDGRNGQGNRKSIAIEICEVANQEKANRRAADLCRKLLKQYPFIPIVPHRYWIDKNCPHLLLPNWNSFLGEVYNGEK